MCKVPIPLSTHARIARINFLISVVVSLSLWAHSSLSSMHIHVKPIVFWEVSFPNSYVGFIRRPLWLTVAYVAESICYLQCHMLLSSQQTLFPMICCNSKPSLTYWVKSLCHVLLLIELALPLWFVEIHNHPRHAVLIHDIVHCC